MIYCKELDKHFENKELMFSALKAEKPAIVSKKKSVVKLADTYQVATIEGVTDQVKNQLKSMISSKVFAIKSIDYTKELQLPSLVVKAVTNTTNWFDSHMDVHIDGIWNKTLADRKGAGIPHIQEHEYEFDKVINDAAETTVESTTFRALGFNYDGNTQALRIKSVLDPNRNIFMYNQYANGWVKNHSVGMQYVSIIFCANSQMDNMKEEKAAWDLYYPVIANKDDVDQYGYFWAVTEAKLKEHSAVVFGSNEITPTETVEIEADKSLLTEADKSLQAKQSIFSNLKLVR